jgi:hypothetical protein
MQVPSHLFFLDIIEVKLYYVLLVLSPKIGLLHILIVFYHNLAHVQVVPPTLLPPRAGRLRVLVLRIPSCSKACLHLDFEISSLGATGLLCATPTTIMLHEFWECLQLIIL